MKKFLQFFCEWISPIAATIGCVLLVFIDLNILIDAPADGVAILIMAMFVFVHWAYGFVLCRDVIPFIKRIFRNRRT